MIDHRVTPARERRAGRTHGLPRDEHRVWIELAELEARVLREVLAESLRALETRIAGNDWQDLGAETRLRCKVLRRLLDELAA
jgi:hypothetical protein